MLVLNHVFLLMVMSLILLRLLLVEVQSWQSHIGSFRGEATLYSESQNQLLHQVEILSRI